MSIPRKERKNGFYHMAQRQKSFEWGGEIKMDIDEDLLADEKAVQGVSLTAAEVRRLVFTAYKMGIAEGRKGDEA